MLDLKYVILKEFERFSRVEHESIPFHWIILKNCELIQERKYKYNQVEDLEAYDKRALLNKNKMKKQFHQIMFLINGVKGVLNTVEQPHRIIRRFVFRCFKAILKLSWISTNYVLTMKFKFILGRWTSLISLYQDNFY